jgi:hypothetical protein
VEAVAVGVVGRVEGVGEGGGSSFFELGGGDREDGGAVPGDKVEEVGRGVVGGEGQEEGNLGRQLEETFKVAGLCKAGTRLVSMPSHSDPL